MEKRLQQVGEVERPQHFFLEAAHRCYFWGEYTPWEHTEGKRWDYSETNRLIANFKKGMDRQGKDDWHHKVAAIDRISLERKAAPTPTRRFLPKIRSSTSR